MILSFPFLPVIPKRIISLVPSQTELLHYLELEEETIALTKFCVHPDEWFKTKERIGGTKALNIEKIISLQPDLVIANKEENVKEQVLAIAEHCPVWVTDVNNLEDAGKMITDVGSLCGKNEKAIDLAENIKKLFPSPAQDPIPVAYLIWKDPFMTTGGDTFISDMLRYAGFKNVFAHLDRYPEVSVQQICSSGCKRVFLSSEPYPFSEKHVAALQQLLPGILVQCVDGELFSWYGSRLLQAAPYFSSLHTGEAVS